MKQLFDRHETFFHTGRLYIDDYCVWIQKVRYVPHGWKMNVHAHTVILSIFSFIHTPTLLLLLLMLLLMPQSKQAEIPEQRVEKGNSAQNGPGVAIAGTGARRKRDTDRTQSNKQ